MAVFKRRSRVFRIICSLLAILLIQNSLERSQAQPTPFLPSPNYIDLSIPYSFPVLRGMRVHPDKPFEFDFVVDSGDQHALDQKETSLLIKYFLTFLTIPEEDLWVNLSPYEKNHIIPDELALTNAGNTLLDQDKVLKQLSSSLTYPETSLGKKFWEQVYKKAYEKYGTTNLAINTYNKVWIVPDKAVVYDMGDSAMIGDTHLKVMMEEDYLAMQKNKNLSFPNVRQSSIGEISPEGRTSVGNPDKAHSIASEITKEIILPELQKEINTGKNFAPVRQLFYSLVLADWFKRELKRNILSEVYVNKKKISGVNDVDKNSTEKIYKQYLHIFKKGAYNYIREDVDPITNQMVPRKYFSGGYSFAGFNNWGKTLQLERSALFGLLKGYKGSNFAMASVRLTPIGFNPIGGLNDSAQLASFLRNFVLTVAIAAAGTGVAQAAQIKHNPDGKTVNVTVEKNDTFGKILLDAGYGYDKNFWKPKDGTVAKVGEIVKDKIPNVNNISVGSNFDMPTPKAATAAVAVPVAIPKPANQQVPSQEKGTPGAASVKADNTARQAAPLPTVTAPIPQQTAPIVQANTGINNPAPQPHYGKNFYPYENRLPAIAVADVVTAKLDGFVKILHPEQMEREKDEPTITITNLELESHITEDKDAIERAKDLLARLEKAKEVNPQSVTDIEMKDAQKEVQRSENELAKDLAREDLGKVKAPNKGTIIDWETSDGAYVREGAPLYSSFDGDRVRFDVYLPTSVHSDDFELTLDGKPVRSVESFNWLPTTSPLTSHLSLMVTPSEPIAQGQKVSVSLKVYYPENNIEKLLNGIAIKGSPTSVEVPKVKPYYIQAPANGSITYFVREGDKVKAGQIGAHIDAKPASYAEQLKQAKDAFKIIDNRLNEALSSPETIGITEINRLKAEKSKWSAETKRLQELIPHLDVKFDKDSVVAWSAEHGSGVVKSGEDIFSYRKGTVFLGDLDNPQNGVLFPEGPIIKRGQHVLVTTKEGVRLIGEVMNAGQAFNSDIQAAGQSLQIKMVYNPQDVLRTGMFVKVDLLDAKNEAIAQTIVSQWNSTQAASSSPPPPPKNQFGEMANTFSLGQNSPIVSLDPDPGEPQTSFSVTQGTSLSLAEIEKQVRDNKLTAVTQRYTHLQKQLVEKFPNSKYLGLDFNVYTTGGKTYFGGGIAGQLPNLAINMATGNAYGAVAPVVGSYFLKVAQIVTHEKAKQLEFAKIMTEIAMLDYQVAVEDQTSQAKIDGIDLGAQQQKIALAEQLMSELDKGRQAIAVKMGAGVSTEEQLRAFDDIMAQARAEKSKSRENGEKDAVALNTLMGQKNLHEQAAINLTWEAEFPAPSPDQEKGWNDALLDVNPQISQAKAEIAAVQERIKLQKPKGWGTDVAGVYSSHPISDSFTEPAFGGGEEQRASTMNTGENSVLGFKIPLRNGPKKIEDSIMAQELGKRQAELDLEIRDRKKELATNVITLREKSDQIKEEAAAYQNALFWWKLKARFVGTLYSPQDWEKERAAMNKWAMELIDLKKEYFKAQEKLKELGVLKADDSLVIVKATKSDQAQLAFSRRSFILGVISSVAYAVAQQGPQDPAREFNAWKSKAGLPGGNSRADNVSDTNIFNRGPALTNILAQYRGTKADVDRLVKIAMSSYSDVKQEIFRFMVERQDLRFLIQMIDAADKKNTDAVNRAYQSIGDIFINDPKKLVSLRPSSFAPNTNYPDDQTYAAQKAFLIFIGRNPNGLAQSYSLLGVPDEKQPESLSYYWRTDELAHIHNQPDSYFSPLNNGKAEELKKLIFDGMVRRILLEKVDHLTKGELQNADSYSPSHNDDNVARGQGIGLPEQYHLFFNSPGWRQEMEKKLRPDWLAEARQAAQNLIDTDRKQNQSPEASKSNNPQWRQIPQRLAAQESLTFFGLWDPFGQQRYIVDLVKAKNISELARILEARTILKDPRLLSDVLNGLMADKDGRLLVWQAYAQSPDDEFLKLIEAAQHQDTVKKDAQAVKNPAAMRIFREGSEKMYGRLGYPWFRKAFLSTRSFVELYLSPIDSQAKEDRVKFIARKLAVTALLEEKEVLEKDSFVSGRTVYTAADFNFLRQLNDILEYSNDLKEVDDLIKKQPAGPLTDRLNLYTNDYVQRMNGNNQEITKGGLKGAMEWGIHTGLLEDGLLITTGAASILLPIFRDWTVRTFSGLEKLIDISAAKAVNNKMVNGKGINKNKLEPKVAGLITAWEDDLKNFSKNGAYPPQELLNYQEQINKLADAVIMALPYIPHLMDSESAVAENRAYLYSYATFMKLAARTIKALADRLKSEDLTPDQRKQYQRNTVKMLLKMIYGEKYLDILQGRVNMNTSINEHFHKEDWKEMINKPTTLLLGFDYVAYKSKKKIGPDLEDLMKTGNLVIPDLYMDIDGYVNESLKRLGVVFFQGERFGSHGYAETDENIRVSSFNRRLIFLLPTAHFVVKSILGLYGFIPFDLFNVFSSIGTLCFTLAVYWGPLLANSRAADNKKIKEIIVRLYNRTNESLGSEERAKRWKPLKRKIKEEARILNVKVQAADAAAISSPARAPGGIDLNFQPQFIEQFSRTGSARIQEGINRDMPAEFKGFNFNIVRFTSQLTVNGAFQLMFNEAS